MEQNTTSWYEWRNSGLGASDSPIIMGISPYKTALELWKEKTGLVQLKNEGSFVTDLGHRFEPVVRADLTLDLGYQVDPKCVEREDHTWLRASLDGYNEEERMFAEIKYTGAKNIKHVKDTNTVIPHHYPQIQHQFMVTGFENCYYSVYTLNSKRNSIDEIFTIKVEVDQDYIESSLFPRLSSFWDSVVNKTEPTL